MPNQLVVVMVRPARWVTGTSKNRWQQGKAVARGSGEERRRASEAERRYMEENAKNGSSNGSRWRRNRQLRQHNFAQPAATRVQRALYGGNATNQR